MKNSQYNCVVDTREVLPYPYYYCKYCRESVYYSQQSPLEYQQVYRYLIKIARREAKS